MTDIDTKYQQLGGPGGLLGAAESAEQATPDSSGRYRHYAGGSIYWSAATGAHEVHGGIREKYAQLGWEQGFLGYPTTDETVAPDGLGRYNHFQHGSIYWTSITGAYESHGEIRDLWGANGWERGPLGYPVTDELSTPSGYRWQGFQRGAVRWHPDEGARRGSPPDALWGVADLHTHPTAHLGFGGKLVWGRPTGSLQDALPQCDPSHGPLGVAPVADALEETIGHLTGGWPDFDGWPSFHTRLHQQMHVDWIRRAYDGGLRVLCALVNNSELLGAVHQAAGHPLGDREVTDLELTATVELVRGQPWMEIARTPADARRIVAEDRLAVVLGLEVDSFGGWGSPEDCDATQLRAELTRLRETYGVAMITPIHLADNAFGGASLYEDFFAINSRVLRGRWQNIVDAQGSTAFRLFRDPFFSAGPGFDWLIDLIHIPGHDDIAIGDLRSEIGALRAATGTFNGHVNGLGLTDLGREMLTAMMDYGMLIDIDHMSDRATDDALTLAEARRYPIVSSHATFRDLAFDESEARGREAFLHALKHESSKTQRTLERIRALNGIVACQLNQGVVRDFDVSNIANDSAGSSKSWAQAYLYALQHMGGRSVALGTDFNGFARACCPRFGAKAAAGLQGEPERRTQADHQANGVRYLNPLQDYRASRWDDELYSVEEREVWEAVAVGLSGADPEHLHLPPARPTQVRLPGIVSWITNVAKGLQAATLESIPEPNLGTFDFLGGFDSAVVRRGAFLARTGVDLNTVEDEAIRRVAQRIRPILDRFTQMQGPNPPLERSVAGKRDFDINIDGVAHYGLLPDFWQDVNNAGLSWDTLQPLFRSAEDFIRVWDRCAEPRVIVNPNVADIPLPHVEPQLRPQPQIIPNLDAVTISPDDVVRTTQPGGGGS